MNTSSTSDLCNTEVLTPVSFLRRAALVHADRTALVDGPLQLTYSELWDRTRRLAGGLVEAGIRAGERVAVLSSNSHVLLESHYAVPLSGAVLVALNVRLSADELGYIIGHSGARLLLCDADLADLAAAAVAAAGTEVRAIREGTEYEALADCDSAVEHVTADERDLLAINYTSGTTGRPKGVMYHHRGAYLQSLAMVVHSSLTSQSSFLWTLPMFHCNGWCFTWAVTAAGAAHVCLRQVEPARIWRAIDEFSITHFNAAPTVLIALANHEDAHERPIELAPIRVATGGSPPSPTLLARLESLGIAVTHLYGLTESFGPVAICDPQPGWDKLPEAERAVRRARQGVPNLIASPFRVVTSEGVDAPHDGESVGEVLLRGNDVMLGYFEDEQATRDATQDGWLRTGDLGVIHPDGYLELKDRAKDVIISGGENISSVEVEQAIASHPAVLDVAVVAVPDGRWGERPAAWVVLKPSAMASAEELRDHVCSRLARFKAPDRFEFVDELPKTATGKIRKFELRRDAWGDSERRIA